MWKKEILGEKSRGPVVFSFPPRYDPTADQDKCITVKWPDGLESEVYHITMVPSHNFSVFGFPVTNQL